MVIVLATLLGSAGPSVRGADHPGVSIREPATPTSVLGLVRDFTFELGGVVQSPKEFLARRRGDCDDFALLASTVLARSGYRVKLVVVMMERETHVVCHVPEAGGYLDFNRRAASEGLVASDGSLEDIADKVAASFRSTWWRVSEFRFHGRRPLLLGTAYRRGPATGDPGMVSGAGRYGSAGGPPARLR